VGVALIAALAAACADNSTGTSPTAVAGPETFAGQFGIGGGAARAFVAAAAGDVTLTLTEAGPPAGVGLGLAIGIPRANDSGCNLTQTVRAVAATAPQLTAPVQAGTYCVRLYDIGELTSQVAFSVTILHP
jgi:hypothetical protein